MNCPRCEKEISNPDVVFCPYCSEPLTKKRFSDIPIVSGVLSIIAAVVIILGATLSIDYALSSYGGFGYGFISGTNIFFWAAGIFELIAFSFGLTGAIFQLRKKQILLSIFSSILVIVASGILIGQSIFTYQLNPYYFVQYSEFLYLAVPAIVLSILSLVFIAISRRVYKK